MLERKWCFRITNVMDAFFRQIEDMELHDPHLIGDNLTFFRGINHSSEYISSPSQNKKTLSKTSDKEWGKTRGINMEGFGKFVIK